MKNLNPLLEILEQRLAEFAKFVLTPIKSFLPPSKQSKSKNSMTEETFPASGQNRAKLQLTGLSLAWGIVKLGIHQAS